MTSVDGPNTTGRTGLTRTLSELCTGWNSIHYATKIAQSIKGANQLLSAIVQVMKTYLQSAAQLLVCVRREGSIGNIAESSVS